MARLLDRGAAHKPHGACDAQPNSQRARCARETCPAKRHRCGVAMSFAGDPLRDPAASVEASPKLIRGRCMASRE